MIVYFSGTGNSRYAAQLIADKTHDTLIDAGKSIRGGGAMELHSERPWIFVCPTYAWQIPHIFEQLIRNSRFSGNRSAYFVMTCGDSIGNAGSKLAVLCKEKNLTFMGVLPLVMPENYIAMFEVPLPPAADAIVMNATQSLQRQIPLILQSKPFAALNISWRDRCYTSMVNPLFYTFAIRTRPFHSTDACIHCGKCERLCPLNNIRLKDGTPNWGDHCTHCMACICSCPVQAIEFGKISLGKPRYLCREYTKEDNASMQDFDRKEQGL